MKQIILIQSSTSLWKRSRDSSVSIRIMLWADPSKNMGSISGRGRYFSFPSRHPGRVWSLRSYLSNRYCWLTPKGQSGRDVKLITRFHLVMSLKICGIKPSHPHTSFQSGFNEAGRRCHTILRREIRVNWREAESHSLSKCPRPSLNMYEALSSVTAIHILF